MRPEWCTPAPPTIACPTRRKKDSSVARKMSPGWGTYGSSGPRIASSRQYAGRPTEDGGAGISPGRTAIAIVSRVEIIRKNPTVREDPSDNVFDPCGAALECTDVQRGDGRVAPVNRVVSTGGDILMLRTRILDLDGSLAPQADLFAAAPAEWVPGREWGPRIRLACDFGAFDRFRGWLGKALPADGPCVTFYGSGDFHHVTLALLGR